MAIPRPAHIYVCAYCLRDGRVEVAACTKKKLLDGCARDPFPCTVPEDGNHKKCSWILKYDLHKTDGGE